MFRVYSIYFLILMRAATTVKSMSVLSRYEPPSWALNAFTNLPQHGRVRLGNFPTPLQLINCRDDPKNVLLQKMKKYNITLHIKREDMSGGLELGGNKVRKLEFLIADAIGDECTDVVTIGGEQSNHVRATAAACRIHNMNPHLILRTKKSNLSDKYTGNILLDRMLGSNLYTCTPGEYGRIGSHALVERLCAHLGKQKNPDESTKKPYAIPVGGSNGLGTWGYIDAVQEVSEQLEKEEISVDHLVFATGSGGTAAGITLGTALKHGATSKCPKLHAIGVCDDEDYFYKTITNISDEMGFIPPHTKNEVIENYIRKHLTVHQGKGKGYAMNTAEELDFITSFAIETGIVLDPVYTGKALFHFATQVLTSGEEFENSSILFWHTGGTLGMFDKGDDLLATFQKMAPVKKLDVYGKSDPETFKI